MDPPTVAVQPDGSSLFCWRIRFAGCTPSMGACCPTLAADLWKVGFRVVKSCTASLLGGSLDDGALPQATYVETAPGAWDANVKVTSLRLDAASVGSTGNRSVCIQMAAPCGDLPALCGNPEGRCDLYQSNQGQTCCPTCRGMGTQFPPQFPPFQPAA
eukprot:238247-Chlamydomonas_euryale.AAC.3